MFHRDHPNFSQEKIAESFTRILGKPVLRGAMSRILKHKDKFLNSPDKYDHMINLRDPEEMELEDEVYNMYCIKSSQGIKMTHKDLTEVAYAFSKQAKYGGYFIRHKFAFGWIANWKKAYGIE